MFADIQIAKQCFKFVRTVEVIIIPQRGKKQTLAEFARTDEKLIFVALPFQQLNEPCLIHVSIILGDYTPEIRIAVWQSFVRLCFHLLFY
jgi:hypothetical protein